MALSLLFCGIVSLFVTSAWGGSSDVQVGFVMMQHLEHGQEFRIVIGSGRELGDWIISKGLPMTYHEGNLWTASVEVEIEDVNGANDFEYKVVVVDGYYGGKAVCSMPGPNRIMNILCSHNLGYQYLSIFLLCNRCLCQYYKYSKHCMKRLTTQPLFTTNNGSVAFCCVVAIVW